MSSVHNDLHSWAGKARAHGNDTIVITVDLADKAADEIVSQAGEIAELKYELMAERERHGWQNIDTVPKDGTIVDLWHVKGFRVVDEWWDAEDGWTGGWSEDAFTHWMKSPIANP